MARGEKGRKASQNWGAPTLKTSEYEISNRFCVWEILLIGKLSSYKAEISGWSVSFTYPIVFCANHEIKSKMYRWRDNRSF